MTTWNHELYHYGKSHLESKTGRGSGRYPWNPLLHLSKKSKKVEYFDKEGNLTESGRKKLLESYYRSGIQEFEFA